MIKWLIFLMLVSGTVFAEPVMGIYKSKVCGDGVSVSRHPCILYDIETDADGIKYKKKKHELGWVVLTDSDQSEWAIKVLAEPAVHTQLSKRDLLLRTDKLGDSVNEARLKLSEENIAYLDLNGEAKIGGL